MTALTEHPVSGWSDFVALAGLLQSGDGLAVADLPYVFRGHEDFDWHLQSTLQRAATRDGISALPLTKRLLSIEKDVTDRFRAIAAIHLNAATLKTTNANLDWWTVMRHHGVPTRVLDWTSSLYIAAYFACSRLPAKDAGIYVLHVGTLNQAMLSKHGAAASLPGHPDVAYADPAAASVISVMSRATAQTDRMIAQQGVFMACRNVATDIEDELAATVRSHSAGVPTLLKIRVKSADKSAIMRQLGAMNVSANSLFPGPDGAGRYLDELVRHRLA